MNKISDEHPRQVSKRWTQRSNRAETRRRQRALLLACAGAAAVVLSPWPMPSQRENVPRESIEAEPKKIESLDGLLTQTVSEIESNDVALLNLICAQGLPGNEGLNIHECLAVLESWASRVRTETERHWHRFHKAPAEFQNSSEIFRILMLGTVLQEDCHVGYNPKRMTAVGEFEPNDVFFADSRDVFVHGLLSGKRQGTCSSLPILYLAIGRQLGYPLKLVTAKAHLFLRWEDRNARFNIECTGRGVGIYDDDHYRQWPIPMSAEEEVEGGYLKSLSGAETLAMFLNLRGQCLLTAGRKEEALYSHAEAVRLAPRSKSCKLVFEVAKNQILERTSPATLLIPQSAPFAIRAPTLAIEPNPLNQIRTP